MQRKQISEIRQDFHLEKENEMKILLNANLANRTPGEIVN